MSPKWARSPRPWHRSGTAERRLPVRALARLPVEQELELKLVVDRDPVLPHGRYGRFDASRLICSPSVQSGKPHAAPLIEAHRVEVVVGRDEPQPRAPALGRFSGDRGEKRRPDATVRIKRVEGDKLAAGSRQAERSQAHNRPALNGDPRGQQRRIVRVTTADDDRRAPLPREMVCDPVPLSRPRVPNQDLAVSTHVSRMTAESASQGASREELLASSLAEQHVQNDKRDHAVDDGPDPCVALHPDQGEDRPDQLKQAHDHHDPAR